MKKLVAFLIRVALFIALALWLADRPGKATIVWHDYTIETSAAFLGLLVLALGGIFYFLFRTWHTLRHGHVLWHSRRRIRRLEQGHDLLTRGLIAVAGGHAAEAGRLAIAARKQLGSTTATMLLQAQAAQLAHDHRAARGLFRAMAEDEESAVLGYRGLIMEARRAGDWHEVERLTVEAERLHADMPWLDQVRFEAATRQRNWLEAGSALGRLGTTRLLEAKTWHRHRAALLIAQSMQEAEQGHKDKAMQLAEQGARQAPDWMPGIIQLARMQAAGGYDRPLRRTVERGLKIALHPQLIATLRGSGKDYLDAYKVTERLCHAYHDQPAAQLALAEAALAADLWGEARRYLMTLIASEHATAAAFRLMAQLERRESGDEKAVLKWLMKAAESPGESAWICTSCGGAHVDWQPVCRSCGAFGTLEWRDVSQGALTRPLLPALSDWMES